MEAEAAAAAAAPIEAAAAEAAAAVPDPTIYPCDLLGPFQHSGECSFDTLQYLFFNADGLKEITRPLFQEITREDLETLVGGTSRNASRFRDDSTIVDGLLAIQERFKAHYAFLETPELAACAGDPAAIRAFYEDVAGLDPTTFVAKLMDPSWSAHPKRALSAKCSKNAAYCLQDPTNFPFKREEYKPGNTAEHAMRILNYLFELFKIPFILTHDTADRAICMYIKLNQIICSAEGACDPGPGHAMGLVKCNAEWYLYDNNNGVYKISLPMITFILDYIKSLERDFILVIKPHGKNTFFLYKLKEAEGDQLIVQEVWKSFEKSFRAPTSGPFPLRNKNVYYFKSYFSITPIASATADGGRRKTRRKARKGRKSRRL